MTQIKDVGGLLTDVKKNACLRTQFLKSLELIKFLPYLCIVNQIELVTKSKKVKG